MIRDPIVVALIPLATAVLSFLLAIVLKKVKEVHVLVNSNLQAALNDLEAATRENTRLRNDRADLHTASKLATTGEAAVQLADVHAATEPIQPSEESP